MRSALDIILHIGIMNEDVPKGLFLEHFFARISRVVSLLQRAYDEQRERVRRSLTSLLIRAEQEVKSGMEEMKK